MQSVIESECKTPKIVYEAKLVAGESPNGRKNNSDSDSTGYPNIINYQKFSSFINLIRVLAWTLRFIKRVKKIPMSWSHLTYSELQNAKILVIKSIQAQNYGDIKTALKDKKRNNLISQLGVVLDQEGIICVGRLKDAQLSEGARTPILLPRKNHVTGLIIEYIHKKPFHVGVSQTLSLVCQDYWIPKGRAEVKRILHKCTICKRFDGGPYKMPLMPALPKKRVSESAPFTYMGVDYFGPIFIKTETGNKKVWVSLFTCLVVRAIHLELMQDMSTEQFLLGLRRFIARWDKPKQIISDNGAQFKHASLLLDKSWERVTSDSDVQSYIANEEIQWQFIVELAPWMGGFYERLVGFVKRCLRKTIGKLCLTNEQMRTMLAEAEAVVNSRPLVYIGDDINSNITLTPAHFLTLNPKIGFQDSENFDPMDPDYVPVASSVNTLLAIWKKGQRLLDTFWKTWRDEYLLNLRERTSYKLKGKRIQDNRPVQIGDFVLIKEDLPRGSWKIGRICDLTMSQDGQYRSGKVMLPNKRTLNRPLNLLYPIECTDKSDLGDSDMTKEEPAVDGIPPLPRAKRQAAERATKLIKEQLN
ncbi:uncharacterized protein LOC134235746 [Saccostrea cucullata]|uniref:uncharacterized protein LOC134235746 n=1 Tax=Saccostrea cuccullata TaxID=36930 RepID=UPI002ED36D0A